MTGWICGGCAAGLALLLLVVRGVVRGNVYRKLFADERILEFARRMGGVKEAACERLLARDPNAIPTPDDPRVILTPDGLAFVYTISNAGGRFVHHMSVSIAGGYTAHAVGGFYILLTAKLLGIPYERLKLGIGKSTVHHAEFELSETEQAEFRTRTVAPFTSADITAFRKELVEADPKLDWLREPQ